MPNSTETMHDGCMNIELAIKLICMPAGTVHDGTNMNIELSKNLYHIIKYHHNNLLCEFTSCAIIFYLVLGMK